MITHNMRDALRFGNRLIMMDSGRIIYDVKGEDFVAYMVLEDNVLVADVMETIRHHRPSIEWPKSIYSIPMLPLTECSKVDKRKLKEWYNKG